MEDTNEFQSNVIDNVFSLINLSKTSGMKVPSNRIKVQKTFDVTHKEDMKWFADTYDHEGNFKADVHLFMKDAGSTYGDMGNIVHVKEDVNAQGTPCFTCKVLPDGENINANKFFLSWETFCLDDMKDSISKSDRSLEAQMYLGDLRNES
ncbi:hypothetical protein KP509_05G001600 [Ceratopteris richardii]|uniref:Uncharacterized protein n=1 Tax=Ceratopteris richardii TaxID=49495 RepID=A0A8T2UQC8_CERRI|nr:hypothetical protein KP509_05G001600 [Ceratopteris richardii]KAH7436086.1 hypothetical protein KP509_05G001600 [Ceratopteris richardii]